MESNDSPTSRPPRRRSLDATLASWMVLVALGSGLSGMLAARWFESFSTGILLLFLLSVVFATIACKRFLAPIYAVLQALTDGVSAMRDSDFSLSLSTDRNDELSDLLKLYNEVASALREERQSIYQRELLLDSVIQASPLALLLATDRGSIIYSNTAARRWFFAGRKIEGRSLSDLLEALPAELSRSIEDQTDGLVGLEIDGQSEIFHVTHRWFHLNARRHRLILLERLTREINRKEVETWKKVIRLISHELRNSLGPIASLARSGRKLRELPNPTQLLTVLETIEERAEHLESFISGYAQFAKLPQPRLTSVVWSSLMSQLHQTEPFERRGSLPVESGYFDVGQIELALVNLLRNARESGSPADAIEVEVGYTPGEQWIAVRDRGSGMSPKVLESALLPFYSTKRSGTGLGLPLCREIAEAHGGSLQVANRPNGGLEIVIYLPWVPPQERSPEVCQEASDPHCEEPSKRQIPADRGNR